MFFKSVEKLAIVDPGVNGAMGTITPGTHDIYAKNVVRQSFNVNLPPGTTIREWADGADVPSIAVAGPKEAATISWRMEKMTLALLTLFLGGTTESSGVGGPMEYVANVSRSTIYKSLQVDATEYGGQQLRWAIPYGLLNAGLVGNPSKDAEGKVEINAMFEILMALDANGDAVAPWKTWDINDTSGT